MNNYPAKVGGVLYKKKEILEKGVFFLGVCPQF
jgi:hypothetical protein